MTDMNGLNPATTLKLLSGVKLFDGFGPADLESFINRSTSKQFRERERIFTEGEPGRELHIILSGKVEISRRAGYSDQQLIRLGPGESFGEMALVLPAGVGRTASVTAAEPTVSLSIDRDRLAGIPDVAAKVYANIAKVLASRLKMATDLVVLQAQTGTEIPHTDTIGPARTKRVFRSSGA